MSALWAKLETQVVNGAFPLERCIGSTDRSAVFLTQATRHAPSAVALKLVRFDEAAAERLRRWREGAVLSHPHLLRIFEAGECTLDGARFLYLRTELADQTLAQLLTHRTLTGEEARDLLAPVLDALEYLHARNLAHDGLKASNVLVVGDRLKLATDTLRPIGEPGSAASPATDVHALGALLCEALTGARPAAGEPLPASLPEAFRDLVAGCLSADPAARPTLGGIRAWLDGEAQPAAAAQPPSTRLRIRVELPPEAGLSPQVTPRRTPNLAVLWVVAGVVVLALGAGAYLWLSGGQPPAPAPAAPASPSPASPPIRPAPPPPQPVVAESPPAPAPASALHEVQPRVSRSALETVRGTLRVAVRVTVDAQGAVTAAVSDIAGPSRYFEQRSLEAARQWTFGPGEAGRAFRLRFAFTRSGATVTAEPVR